MFKLIKYIWQRYDNWIESYIPPHIRGHSDLVLAHGRDRRRKREMLLSKCINSRIRMKYFWAKDRIEKYRHDAYFARHSNYSVVKRDNHPIYNQHLPASDQAEAKKIKY